MKKSYLEEIESLNRELYEVKGKWSEAVSQLEMKRSELKHKENDLRVERIPGVEKIVTIYEQDPNLLQRNRDLNEELTLALVRTDSSARQTKCGTEGCESGGSFEANETEV